MLKIAECCHAIAAFVSFAGLHVPFSAVPKHWSHNSRDYSVSSARNNKRTIPAVVMIAIIPFVGTTIRLMMLMTMIMIVCNRF